MRLASSSHGSGRRVTFVHGFTQTRESWLPVLGFLKGVNALLLDAPGHGDSEDGRRSLDQCGDDIAETSPGGILVGYSMGARMALHAVLRHPDTWDGLVLVSGTAGITDPNERLQRRSSDDSLADRIIDIGTEAFLHEWLANPMFAGLDDSTRMLDQRLRNRPTGLADSLRHAGTGTQADLWPHLSSVRLPVLIVTGSNDAKFVEIGSRMATEIPEAEHVTIDGSGHTVHLERTQQFCDALSDWMVRKVPAPDPQRN